MVDGWSNPHNSKYYLVIVQVRQAAYAALYCKPRLVSCCNPPALPCTANAAAWQ